MFFGQKVGSFVKMWGLEAICAVQSLLQKKLGELFMPAIFFGGDASNGCIKTPCFSRPTMRVEIDPSQSIGLVSQKNPCHNRMEHVSNGSTKPTTVAFQ